MDYGMPTLSVLEFLNPLRLLEDNANFWRYQSDGLAVFLSPENFLYYRLPVNFEPLAVTGKTFHIKPLLPVISNDGLFYVLSLNIADIRLIQGTHYTLNEVGLKNVPETIAESLRYYEFDESPCGISLPVREELSRFLREIHNGVRRLLEGQAVPLVLAGAEHIRAFYREVNDYPCLAERDIEGQPENFSIEELHDRAWAIVEPGFRKVRLDAVDRYRVLAARGDTRAAGALEIILPAAYRKRVETLIVPLRDQVFGRFDPEHDGVAVHEKKEPGDEDLLNTALIHTVLNGGEVYALSPGEMPEGATAIAVLRN
jgi:hypothetical protein